MNRPFNPNHPANRRERPNINEAIRTPNVRLISSSGEQLGILPTHQALQKAREEGLDLVVIGTQTPPVAKIMNYGKYKFEQEKQEKENKKRSKLQSVMKEVKLSPRIDEHDLMVKEKKVWEWLAEGHKVRIVAMLRGREMQHPELARQLLEKILANAAEYGKPDRLPAIRQEGKFFNLQLNPLQQTKSSPKQSSGQTEQS
ncbi:MAG: translation initiation factor IF-3 [Candidatus Caenarcaniphilales bacterium]|nr:translation initiation factor IF-3 [Candidatus Caenarcaniphilales bacterium]